MTDHKEIMTVEEWAQQYSAPIVSQVITALQNEEEAMGPTCEHLFTTTYLTGMITVMVLQVLRSKAKNTEDPLTNYDNTSEAYGKLKLMIQDAVASGFTMAMTEFAKKPIDYYCILKTMPEATNKNAC